METKTCRVCGVEKNIEEFPIEGLYRANRCKTCRNEHARKWARANRERATESQRKYRESDPERYKKHMKKHSEKVAEKRKRDRTLKSLFEILNLHAELKEDPIKFKDFMNLPVRVLTEEQKKIRNKIKQREWRENNSDSINLKKASKRAAMTKEQKKEWNEYKRKNYAKNKETEVRRYNKKQEIFNNALFEVMQKIEKGEI